MLLSLALLTGICHLSYSQTSWKGAISTSWNNASNWTNGVPTPTTDAILGDGNFSGSFQPTVNVAASCKSLTVGGARATTVTLTKNLVASGNVTNSSNGTISQPASTLTLSGNWVNNGIYSTTSSSARVIFGGVAQSIGGSAVTTFRRIKINTASTVTLANNITVSGTNSYLYVYGVLNPSESPGYTITSTILFKVFNNGKIKVNASGFTGNYILSGTVNLAAGAIVEYSSTSTNQTISNSFTYSTLIVSGTGVKSLAGNLPSLNSSNSSRGNIFVNSGTLDLLGFTANRGTAATGGNINVANGAILKIGSTNTFPSNYNTVVLSLNSTVEYNGTAQIVSARSYGNLILSSASGSVSKTFPGAAFTIAGNFTSIIGSGTGVSYSSASNITFNGSVTIGTSTTFNGSSNTHIVRGNWINNGTFSGSTGTIQFDGASSGISGSALA
ncbi:MAG: hypothetical protein EOP49_35340, partial [Sphingobacteriales bacterium]